MITAKEALRMEILLCESIEEFLETGREGTPDETVCYEAYSSVQKLRKHLQEKEKLETAKAEGQAGQRRNKDGSQRGEDNRGVCDPEMADGRGV